jgi:hypothetical protein
VEWGDECRLLCIVCRVPDCRVHWHASAMPVMDPAIYSAVYGIVQNAVIPPTTAVTVTMKYSAPTTVTTTMITTLLLVTSLTPTTIVPVTTVVISTSSTTHKSVNPFSPVVTKRDFQEEGFNTRVKSKRFSPVEIPHVSVYS